MTIRQYKSPTGHPIIGTAEIVPGVALIEGIDPVTGEAIYTGDTKLYHEKQRTVLTKRGQVVYVDSAGGRWCFHDIKTADKAAVLEDAV